jgi:hypothetical protein
MLLWIRRIGFEILIWAIYLCVAIAFTYPLIFHMSDHLPGAGADAVQYYWFAWWDGLSIFSSHFSPFYCPLVLYPQGAHLNAEPLPFGLVYGILSHALPPILAYNLLYLLLYAFSAWGGYKLSLYLWNSRKVALFTGVVFGFSPFMTFHGIGHVNMLNGGFVALMVLASLKAMDLSRFHPGKVLVAGILSGISRVIEQLLLHLFFNLADWSLCISSSQAPRHCLCVESGRDFCGCRSDDDAATYGNVQGHSVGIL